MDMLRYLHLVNYLSVIHRFSVIPLLCLLSILHTAIFLRNRIPVISILLICPFNFRYSDSNVHSYRNKEDHLDIQEFLLLLH